MGTARPGHGRDGASARLQDRGLPHVIAFRFSTHKLKRFRAATQATPSEVARDARVSIERYLDIESGKIDPLTAESARIARAVGREAMDLFAEVRA
jgi:DNA-binding XRE family transcriptional regulator